MKNNSSVGYNWKEAESLLFTPEEIAESDLRVAIIDEVIRARKERGLTQRGLEELTGVKQPVIARMENGSSIPNLKTLLKILTPLGKTLYIGDISCPSMVAEP